MKRDTSAGAATLDADVEAQMEGSGGPLPAPLADTSGWLNRKKRASYLTHYRAVPLYRQAVQPICQLLTSNNHLLSCGI